MKFRAIKKILMRPTKRCTRRLKVLRPGGGPEEALVSLSLNEASQTANLVKSFVLTNQLSCCGY